MPVLWMFVCLVMLVACQGQTPAPAGALVISTQTDMSVPGALDSLRVQVRIDGQLRHDRSFDVAPAGDQVLPFVITLNAQDEPGGQVDVSAVGMLEGEPRVFARAVTTFPAARTALVELPLQWLCLDTVEQLDGETFVSTCESEASGPTACVAGACRSVEVAERELPDYDPRDVFGGARGPQAGGACFPTSDCFEAAVEVVPNRACEVELPATGEPNLALRLPGESAGDGICAGEQCLVPLDESQRFGFVLSEMPRDAGAAHVRATLPPAVCDALDAGAIEALVLSSTCETKTRRTPTCGPWSSTDDEQSPIEVVVHSNLPADAGPEAGADVSSVDAASSAIELELIVPGRFDDGTASPGDEIELTIVGADAEDAAWSSSDPDVARVDSRGVVTIVGLGSATITATLGQATVSFDVVGVEPGEPDASVIEIPLTPNLESLALSPSAVAIPVGTNAQLRALGTLADGRTVVLDSELLWSTSDASIAEVVDGRVFGVAPGEATVTVQVDELVAHVRVTVLAVELEALQITPSETSLAVGVSAALRVHGLYEDGQSIDLTDTVTWQSDDPSVAEVNTGGVIIGRSPGSAEVVAEWDGQRATARVTVSDAQVVELAVTPPAATVRVRQSVTFVAEATLSDGTTIDVSEQATWSSVTPEIVSATAGPRIVGLAPGTGAISVVFGQAAVEVSVTVVEAQLTSLDATPLQLSLPRGADELLFVTATYDDGSSADATADVTWSSADAQVASVDEQGRVTANGIGEVVLTARLGMVTTDVLVEVTDAELVELTLRPSELTLPAGRGRQLSALGSYSDGTSRDVSATARWMSSDGSVAGVSASGLVQASASGQATITATIGEHRAQTRVNVTDAVVVDLFIDALDLQLPVGESVSLSAHALYSDGTSQVVTPDAIWSSSAPDVATVSSDGIVTGRSPAVVTIAARFAGFEAEVPLEVTSATVVRFFLEPETVTLTLGTRTTLRAHAAFSDGSVRDVSSRALWTSGDQGVARVSGGVVQGAGVGQATVNARFEEHRAEAVVTVHAVVVTEPVVVALDVEPSSLELPAGSERALRARATYSDGRIIDVTATATWASSDERIAAFADGGLLSAHSPGQVDIRVEFEGEEARATAVVVAPPMELTIAPSEASIAVGERLQLVVRARRAGVVEEVTDRVQWSVQGSSVSLQAGLVVGVAPGQSDVTATFETATVSARITVAELEVTNLRLAPERLEVGVGETATMLLTAFFADGSSRDVSSQAEWFVEGPAIAVDGGRVTGLSAGSGTVYARFQGHETKAAVVVVALELEALRIFPDATIVAVGEPYQLIATGTRVDGVMVDLTQSVAWSTDEPEEFAIDAQGRVLARAAGATAVTASYGQFQASAKLEARAITVPRLVVRPDPLRLGLGQRTTLIVELDDGKEISDVTLRVRAASSDAKVAAVAQSSAALTVEGLSPGVALLRVDYDGLRVDVPVLVTDP